MNTPKDLKKRANQKWTLMEAELTESIKEMREGRSDTELSELTGMARGTVWSFMTSAGGPPRIKTLT